MSCPSLIWHRNHSLPPSQSQQHSSNHSCFHPLPQHSNNSIKPLQAVALVVKKARLSSCTTIMISRSGSRCVQLNRCLASHMLSRSEIGRGERDTQVGLICCVSLTSRHCAIVSLSLSLGHQSVLLPAALTVQAQQHRQDAEEKDAFAWFFEDEERGSDDDGSAPTDVVSEAVESECLGVSREGQQQQQQQVGAVDADSEGQQQQQQHIQQSIPLLPPSSVHTLVQQAAHALSHGRDHEMRLSAAALTALITQHAIAIDHHHTDQHMNQQHRPSPNTCSTPSAPLNRPQSSPSQHSLLPIHSMQHSDQHQHQQSDQRTQHAIERSDHHRCVNTGQHMHQQHAHQQMHHIQQRCAAIDCSTHVHVLHLLGPNKHRSRVVHGACIPLGEGVGVQGGRTAAASELCDLLQRRRKSVHHGNGTLSKQQSQHCLEPQDAYQQQQQPQSNTEHSHNTPSPHSTSLSILFLEGGLGIVRPSHTHSNQASPSAHAPATKHIAGKAGTAPKGLKKGFFAVSPAPHTQPRTATSTPTLKSASPAAQASSQAAAAAVPCIDTASVSGRGTASGPVSLVSQPEQLASLIEGQRLEQAAAAVWAALDPLKVSAFIPVFCAAVCKSVRFERDGSEQAEAAVVGCFGSFEGELFICMHVRMRSRVCVCVCVVRVSVCA